MIRPTTTEREIPAPVRVDLIAHGCEDDVIEQVEAWAKCHVRGGRQESRVSSGHGPMVYDDYSLEVSALMLDCTDSAVPDSGRLCQCSATEYVIDFYLHRKRVFNDGGRLLAEFHVEAA